MWVHMGVVGTQARHVYARIHCTQVYVHSVRTKCTYAVYVYVRTYIHVYQVCVCFVTTACVRSDFGDECRRRCGATHTQTHTPTVSLSRIVGVCGGGESDRKFPSTQGVGANPKTPARVTAPSHGHSNAQRRKTHVYSDSPIGLLVSQECLKELYLAIIILTNSS